jgi:hypothetical protein
MLTLSKIIGDIKYYKIDNRYVMFLITKNKDKQLSTYETVADLVFFQGVLSKTKTKNR